MPEITIANLKNKTIHTENKRENLLDVLLQETDWTHACGGKGRCTTCKARIINGVNGLSKPTQQETQFKNLGRLRADERLCCQVMVEDDLLIEVPEETQLPHLTYE